MPRAVRIYGLEHSQVSPVCILIVDDDDDDRRLLRHVLESRFGDSIRIIETESISRCDQLFLQHTIDMVCLDLMLPGGEGPASVSRIRSISRVVPIVIVTGVGRDAASLETMLRGGDEYVEKSRIHEDLPAAIVRCLKAARSGDEVLRGVLDRLDAIAAVFRAATEEISERFVASEKRFAAIEAFHEQAKRAMKWAAAVAVGVIVTGAAASAIRFWFGWQTR